MMRMRSDQPNGGQQTSWLVELLVVIAVSIAIAGILISR